MRAARLFVGAVIVGVMLLVVLILRAVVAVALV
jgi:hypothetical protein